MRYSGLWLSTSGIVDSTFNYLFDRYNIRSKRMTARKSTVGAFTTEAPALREVPAEAGGTPEQAQAWMEDKVVRAVREAGHCAEALAIMDKVFGKPLDTVGVYDTRGNYGYGYGSKRDGRLYPAYLDSEGVDCWGNVWRDKDGFGRDGLNPDGLDKDGFNKAGFDVDGFDREGKDANGVSKNDPSRYVYDIEGRDKDGYDRSGFDRNGFNREGVSASGRKLPENRFVFDSRGYDVDGYNRDGYKADGSHSDAVYRKYRQLRTSVRF